MRYKLLKDIHHPFGDIPAGIIKTEHEWLDEFGVDWISWFEKKIINNKEWFKEALND